VFGVSDGGFVRHLLDVRDPMDVEEVEGGWLVACYWSHCVQFVGDGVGGGRPSLGNAGSRRGSGDGEFNGPAALALVPGLGLVVRENLSGRLQVFGGRSPVATV
jgi:hypothetical protein